MPKSVNPISNKSVAIIAGAVVLTIFALILISINSDNATIAPFVPNILKKKPRATTAPVASPFGNSQNRILFAKNGDQEIFKEERDGQWVVIIDGQESALYDAVDNATFSEDGSEFAYSAELDGQEFVIMDGQQQGKSYLNIKQLLFNADGSILAYLAETANGDLVVVNGEEGKLYGNIGTLETESGITFLSFTAGDQIVYRAEDGQKTFIVVDTTEGKKYAEISSIYFSDDGKQIAYYASDGTTEYTIINGKVTESHPIVTPTIPTNPGNTNPTTDNTKVRKAKDSSRNLSPDIDNQPSKLNPLICGQTTDCNF